MPGKRPNSLLYDGQNSLGFIMDEMARLGYFLRREGQGVIAPSVSRSDLEIAQPWDLATAIMQFVSDNTIPDYVSNGLAAIIYMDLIHPYEELDRIVRSFGTLLVGMKELPKGTDLTSGIELPKGIVAMLSEAQRYTGPDLSTHSPYRATTTMQPAH